MALGRYCLLDSGYGEGPNLIEKREEILRLCGIPGARTARGEAEPGSDVDILVEMEHGRSLYVAPGAELPSLIVNFEAFSPLTIGLEIA